MEPSPILVRDVTKRYRGGRGVENVDLEVSPGEVFAFLGPNGAGKTTTIRILLDLIRPDSGTVELFGLDLRAHSVEIRRRIGYLPGDLALYEHLSARELLTHFAHLREGPSFAAIQALVDAFELELDKPIRALSKGNRQKVGLIQAMMGSPPLLILDEPTSGLDPLVQTLVHTFMRDAAAAGRTVFLSSHVLSEVARVADRVGIIREGRIVGVERVRDLRAKAVHHVDVRFSGPVSPVELRSLPHVTVRDASDGRVHLTVTGSLDPVLSVLAAHPVEDLEVREPDLGDVFFTLIGGNAAGAGAEAQARVDA